MKFLSVCIAVQDMKASREFYEKVLHQTVAMDLGANVTYEGGFALQSGFAEMMTVDPASMKWKPNNSELYFEVEEIEKVAEELKQANVELVHDIKEMPWAQRVIRFYAPEGTMIEAGERMDMVVGRLLSAGKPVEEVQKITMMPLPFIQQIQSSLK